MGREASDSAGSRAFTSATRRSVSHANSWSILVVIHAASALIRLREAVKEKPARTGTEINFVGEI